MFLCCSHILAPCCTSGHTASVSSFLPFPLHWCSWSVPDICILSFSCGLFLVSLVLVPAPGLSLVFILLAWYLSCLCLVFLILSHTPCHFFSWCFSPLHIWSSRLFHAPHLVFFLSCLYCYIVLPTDDYSGKWDLQSTMQQSPYLLTGFRVKARPSVDFTPQSSQHDIGCSLKDPLTYQNKHLIVISFSPLMPMEKISEYTKILINRVCYFFACFPKTNILNAGANEFPSMCLWYK